jgi:valyl-tRNA synthetase
MEIATKYSPAAIEDKWYSYWMEKGFFKSVPDEREPYTIGMPPPNVTGVLHMGHMLNNTIQDVLIRKARMEGKNACWVPGTDHASIATEAKVVAKLKAEGIEKADLSREEFLAHAWEWKEKHGGIILDQLKKLGASCDWDRTHFTMDPDMTDAVLEVFVDLHEKGYIYRGVRMVNWDTAALTALSDEEVIHKEVNSKLYHCKYKIVGSNEFITIATTRPETILGDTAICVHPEDARYAHLKDAKAIVPLINREVPIIFDEYVDKDFGTGALKVTPAHDVNDYELGIKHKLESIDIIDDHGKLNDKAQLFVGEDRFTARKKVIAAIDELGQLVKVEEIKNKVGYSERTDSVIEPKLSMQWFMKMDTITKPALDAVMNDDIKLYPPKFKNTYNHWMENIQNWCISRQLWWGQRIPAWYYNNGDIVVALTAEEALVKAVAKSGNQNLTVSDLSQDEDVLDTWFSSWLWPISIFDGFKDKGNKEIEYYYPTNDVVTAPEILFFWVARMIIAGYEYKGKMPFKNVYLTGIVRDKQGRKMSKSLGNSPDPIKLMEQYGADGVRMGMLLCSPAGNDLPFDESLCEQGRNFSNKVWNAFRLVNSWNIEDKPQPASSKIAVEWFDAKFNETLASINDNFTKFRLSDALMSVYKLVWNDFCSWYLEMAKPAYGDSIDRATYEVSVTFFEKILKLMHPFMPFISEEIWHLFAERKEQECLIVSEWPVLGNIDAKLIQEFEIASEIISTVRKFRKDKGIGFKESLSLYYKANNQAELPTSFESLITKLCNLENFAAVESTDGCFSFMVRTNEYYIPVAGTVNIEEEIAKLQEELKYNQGFLMSVSKKLSNERFVNNAPEQVVANERKKQADAEAKIKAIEIQIKSLV